MALRLVQVNLKARDDVALGRFWAAALGWETGSEGLGITNLEPVGFDWPAPSALCIDLVSVPDPETVAYRAHLDLATNSPAQQEELVARLTELGAKRADIGQGEVPWTVMEDPEGNLFCVLEPREIYRDTGAIAAVVVDCADPQAMTAFWGEAVGWEVRETSEHLVRLRAPENVGPYLEFFRRPPGTPPSATASTSTSSRPAATTSGPRSAASNASAPARWTWARARSPGSRWRTWRATSSASSPRRPGRSERWRGPRAAPARGAGAGPQSDRERRVPPRHPATPPPCHPAGARRPPGTRAPGPGQPVPAPPRRLTPAESPGWRNARGRGSVIPRSGSARCRPLRAVRPGAPP